MTQEEKAKRYDEVLERAKQWRNAPNVDKIPTFANKVIEEIFPEVKESEDEIIRKEILDYIDKSTGCERWVAWIKKQRELVNSLSKGLDKAHERIDELIQLNNKLTEQLEWWVSPT